MFHEVAARFAALSDAETPGVPVVVKDLREHQRFFFQALAAATIHPPAGDEGGRPQVCYVLARDISQGGVSLLHPVPLRKQQRIDLQFPDGRNCSAEIRWVNQVEPHCYMMGCKFLAV